MIRFSRSWILKAGLGLVVLSAGACSSSSDSARNTVSPYDTEFDPDPEEVAKIEARKSALAPLAPGEENEMLVEAMQHYDGRLFTAARDTLIKMQQKFPMSYYAVFIELKLADGSYFLGDYANAITQYQEFERLHPKHEALPYVVLQLANSHFAQYRGVMHDQLPAREALKYYKRMLTEFPTSPYAANAADSIIRCEELLAAHENYVAEFYLTQGLTDASANRSGQLKRQVAQTQLPPLKPVQPEQLAMLSSPEPQSAPLEMRARLNANQGQKPPAAPPAAKSATQAADKAAPDPVAVAAVLSCEQLPDQRILTAEMQTRVEKADVRETAAQGGSRKVQINLALPPAPAAAAPAVALQGKMRCSAGSGEFAFAELPPQKSIPAVQNEKGQNKTGQNRTAQLSFTVPAKKNWRVMTLDRPQRIVAIIR